MCSLGSSRQYTIIGSDNGLAPNRRQAIIWVNDGPVFWRIYASIGLNEFLTHWGRDEMGAITQTSNGSWCMGIKGEMSGTVCVTFTWDMYIRVLHQGSSTRQIQPNLSFGQVELTTWLSSFKYQYTRKFLNQSRKWLFGQPARKLSVDPCIYIYIWVVYSLCFFCCLFITVTWWYMWCFEWESGNQEEVQVCLVTLWLFIISCYSLYKTTLGLRMLMIWK